MSYSWQLLLDCTIFQPTEAGNKSCIVWLIAPPPTDVKSTNYVLILYHKGGFLFNTTMI